MIKKTNIDPKIKNFDLKKVDWSKYKDELNEIYQTYDELQSDKKFMIQFKKTKSRYINEYPKKQKLFE